MCAKREEKDESSQGTHTAASTNPRGGEKRGLIHWLGGKNCAKEMQKFNNKGKTIDIVFSLWAKCVPMRLDDFCFAIQKHRKSMDLYGCQRHRVEGNSLWAKWREKGEIKGVSGCEGNREVVLEGVQGNRKQALAKGRHQREGNGQKEWFLL